MFPVLLIVGLFLVPFVSNRGERAPSRRPVAVLTVIVIYTVLGVLTYEGSTAPWSPEDDGLERRSRCPRAIVERRTPLELQGAPCFRTRTAAIAMRWTASGGQRGPDLTQRRHAADARPTDRPGQQRHARAAATCRPTASK